MFMICLWELVRLALIAAAVGNIVAVMIVFMGN